MSKLKLPVSKTDHQRGNRQAEIVLVEYGDFECPYCRNAHPLVKRLLEEKGDELNFVFRNFPLREIHPHAYVSALAAEAAGMQGKFWEMHDLIFENQDRLSQGFLLLLAKELGLNLRQFASDSGGNDVESKIETDWEGGIRSGVNGTPTFFLNGSPLCSYNETYESLLDAFLLESAARPY